MIKYVIALRALGIKNKDLLFLLQNYSFYIEKMFTDESVFENHFELILYQEYFLNKDLVNGALLKADEILKNSRKLDIKVTFYMDKSYPKELAKIDNPPAIIYYKGAEFAEISEHAIACVGTRKPTKLSYNAVNYLVPQWVKNDCSIISGLACGVDKLAHQACISAGGKTVAVLAHGLDIIYPKGNKTLAERILENGGILMSEYPVDTKADRFRFVNRNRIIVGMSRAVIIYECDEKGGTMHNVEFASKQNKPIFCPEVGEGIIDVRTGTKKLIDEHLATVIKEGRDIKGVLTAVGVKTVKAEMKNTDIKKNFLHAVLAILHNKMVLEATIQELRLPFKNDNSFYKNAIKLIDSGELDINELLDSLILNNIASINKTLKFED